MGSVRVAIVGVGNCATSLIQGVEYYKDADPEANVPGLMHVKFGDYHVSDIEFVAAFDVDAKKVGFDLSEAINSSENNTIRICDVPPTGVTVQRGPTLRRPRQVLPDDHRRVRRAPRSTSSRSSRTPGPTSWSPTSRWAPRRPTSSTPSARSTPASASSTRCRCSSPPTPSGPRSSSRPVSRSSATTSSPRSAPPSPTG